MSMFDDDVRKQLSGILSKMAGEVKIVMFTQEVECANCKETHEFAETIAELSDKLSFEAKDFLADRESADALGIDKIPALALLDKTGASRGIVFYGVPAGYEINSWMSAVLAVSGAAEHIPEALSERIAAIDRDVHIQVFIGLSCPYCPAAVVAAHRIALENPRVRADMVEASTFPHLAVKYGVSGVPKTIINETADLVGAHPIEDLLDEIEALGDDG